MSSEIAKSIRSCEPEDRLKAIELETLTNLMYLACYFEKKGLQGCHAAIFFAVERLRIQGALPRVNNLAVAVNLPEDEVKRRLSDLVDAHLLCAKMPRWGDPDDCIYGIGSMGGKLIKTVLLRD